MPTEGQPVKVSEMSADDRGQVLGEALSSRPEALFTPIAAGRASSYIVDQIVSLMHGQKLKVGDQLPSERSLAALLNTSRPTVREALRVLESRGLLRIQVGASGGAFITTPPPDKAGQGFTDLVQTTPTSAASVTEARTILELGVLPLAFERATPEDIQELREIVERERRAIKKGALELGSTIDFHMRLIKCARNEVIDLVVSTLRDAIVESLKATQSDLEYGRRSEEHEQIVDALERGDADAATTIMRTHLERTAARSRRSKATRA